MDVANPIEGVHGLSLDDSRIHTLEVEKESDEEKDKKKEVWLDYESSPKEDDALAAGTQSEAHGCSRVMLGVHVVDYKDTGSDKVF